MTQIEAEQIIKERIHKILWEEGRQRVQGSYNGCSKLSRAWDKWLEEGGGELKVTLRYNIG